MQSILNLLSEKEAELQYWAVHVEISLCCDGWIVVSAVVIPSEPQDGH